MNLDIKVAEVTQWNGSPTKPRSSSSSSSPSTKASDSVQESAPPQPGLEIIENPAEEASSDPILVSASTELSIEGDPPSHSIPAPSIAVLGGTASREVPELIEEEATAKTEPSDADSTYIPTINEIPTDSSEEETASSPSTSPISSPHRTPRRRTVTSLKNSQNEENIDAQLSRVFSPTHRQTTVERLAVMQQSYSTQVKRQAAALEILTSEQSYLKSLKILIDLFLNVIREKRIISDDDIDAIFSGQLETIYNLNVELLRRLEPRVSRDSFLKKEIMIGDIFKDLAPFFKAYCTYCDNFDRAQQTYAELSSTNHDFALLCQQFFENPLVNRLTIPMYLIMPVQRIPRYLLLLQALKDYTPSTDPDYPNLEKAIVAVREVANYVNKSVKNAENRAKVLAISQRFVSLGGVSIVEPHRLILKEGTLTKRSMTDQSLQHRQVYLFNDVFITATSILDKFIPLSTAWVIDKPDGHFKNEFWLASPVKTHLFHCGGRTVKREWMLAINDAVVTLIANNTRLATERANSTISIGDDGVPTFDSVPKRSSFLKLPNIMANTIEFFSRAWQQAEESSTSSAPSTDVLDKEHSDDGFVIVESERKFRVGEDVKGSFEQLTGDQLAAEDLRQDTFPLNSEYICFEPSYNYIFGWSIGYICLENTGDRDVTIAARQRYLAVSPNPTTYTLKPKAVKYFDFKGHWCFEVLEGRAGDLVIQDFTTFGGEGKHNELKML